MTTQFLKWAGLPAPETFDFQDVLDGKATLPFPYILKPKVGGHRSKGVFLIKKQDDLAGLGYLKPEEFVAQEYIVGDEYTCGSVSFDGECLGVIVMRRILREGDTHKCFVEFNPAIEETVRQVVRHLKPFGPLNVQLRLKDGVPYVFELNARCSGTTGARAISGFNEPVIVADYLTKGVKPVVEIKKTTILRYWKELVVEESRLEAIDNFQHSEAGHFTKL
jgi:carbamoyl-phosphate synthase large subunit